jgi:hypothetical protein
MKIFLALLLSLAGPLAALAQNDDAHHGPVVYPESATNAPDTSPLIGPTPPPPDAVAAPAAPAQAPSSFVAPPFGSSPSSPGQKPDDIYDIRPPFFYLHSWLWLWIALGVLALLALIVVLWKWLKPLAALHPKTAYDLALEKLERARGLLDEKNPEPYAVLVSETIRSYLGQRFHAPSTRRTTEEFLRQMQADPATPLAEHRDLLQGFLEACDLVKFAHYQPERDELEQVQQRAVTFVTATRPAEQNGRRP